MTNYFIIPDVQVPYHDIDLFFRVLERGREYDPDVVIVIGDFMDCPSVSTFSKGTAQEYSDSLAKDIKDGSSLLAGVRAFFPDKRILFHMGNHEERLQSYIRKYAPALTGITELELPRLLGLDELKIEVAEKYHVHEGAFVSTHGHLGRLSKYAGMTALHAAERIGLPVVCGHTHRLGVVYSSTGVESLGTRKTVWGMEVGHVMNLDAVSYVKDDVLNWQAGCGIIDVESGKAQPQTISLE